MRNTLAVRNNTQGNMELSWWLQTHENMELSWRFWLALKNKHFLGGFIQRQGNDISLGVQFHPSRKLLASKNISFSGSVETKKVPPIETFSILVILP
jgi:hypothetical protein